MDTRKRSPSGEAEQKFIVRMPSAMHDRIKALAHESRRSINSQYVLMLDSWLNDLDRENYEYAPENDIENFPAPEDQWQSSGVKGLGKEEIERLRREVRETLSTLATQVERWSHRLDILETKHMAMSTLMQSQNRESADFGVLVQRVQALTVQIEQTKVQLGRAKDLLGRLYPFDPDRVAHTYGGSDGDTINFNKRLSDQTAQISKIRKNYRGISSVLADFKGFRLSVYEALSGVKDLAD